MRATDDPAKLAEYLAMRQPADLKITEMASVEPVSALMVEAVKAKETSGAFIIETVKIGDGVEMAREIATYELWERLTEEDSSLPAPYFKDDNEIGISAGKNLPVVGIDYDGQAEKAAEILSRLTGETWFIPTEGQLLESKTKVVVGKNKHGHLYEWTSTEREEGEPYKVVLNLQSGVRGGCHPSFIGYIGLGVRFAKRT